MLSSTRPTVVTSTVTSNVRPVMPWFRITSLAIDYGETIMVTGASKSNGNLDFKKLFLFDELAKFRKQRCGIVRTRRGFRMILHAEDRFRLVSHAFHRLVVQVHAV